MFERTDRPLSESVCALKQQTASGKPGSTRPAEPTSQPRTTLTQLPSNAGDNTHITPAEWSREAAH